MSTVVSSISSKKALCCRCFQPNASVCSLCKAVAYCGKVCQKKDWELGHKIKCKEIRAAAAAAAAATTSSSSAALPSSSSSAPPSSASPAPDSTSDVSTFSTVELSLPTTWLFPTSRLSDLMTAPSHFPPRLVGLLNPKKANSCFYNVVLQTLMYTRPFINLLDTLKHQSEECRLIQQQKFCILCALTGHRKQVLKHSRNSMGEVIDGDESPIVPPLQNGDPRPILPVHLLRNLDKLSSDYTLGQQEDSHDTLKNLLHVFDDAWSKNYTPQPQAGQPMPRLSQRTLETTVISQLFGGYLLSELKCASNGCGKFTSMFEFFLDLSLELIEATDDLNEMLESFSRPERLDGDNLHKCSHCQRPSRARKQITIYQQPNLLMIQLKRFRMGMFGKVNKFIKFPLELSLRKYMSGCKLASDDELLANDPSATSSLSVVYRLYAVIVHLDLLNVSSFGHYICYIADPHSTKGEWLRCDDDEIVRVPVSEVLKLKAYILFYQRSTPFVSSDKVATADEVASSASPSPSGGDSGSAPAGSASPPASEEPVQCIGGCGFWGKPSTNNMCSQCYRKWQQEQGIITQPTPKRPSPAPTSSATSNNDSDMVQALRRQFDQQLRVSSTTAPASSSAASRYGSMLQQLEHQRNLAAMHASQESAARSAQLPPNPLENRTTTTASNAHKSNNANSNNTTTQTAGAKGSGRKFKSCHGKE